MIRRASKLNGCETFEDKNLIQFKVADCLFTQSEATSNGSTKLMKCAVHGHEAIAICAYCGRGLCPDCAHPAGAQRMVCSDNCAKSLARDDRAMQLILQKSVQSAGASSFYSYLCGGLSMAGAVGAWFYLPVPFLIWFTAGCGLVFIASGIWYGRIARKQIGE